MSVLKIPIAPYDDAHLAELRRSPHWSGWEDLFEKGYLTVDEGEVIVHAMFAEQMDREGFSSYRQLALRATSREQSLRDYFDFSSGELRRRYPARETQRGQTERVGVATGILAVNRAAGLIEADWKRIQESNVEQTLDHEWTATDGASRIRLEAKARSVEDPLKRAGVSGAKTDIESKKRVARSAKRGVRATRDYGVITAMSDSCSQMWVLDPEGDPPEESLAKDRVLTRLRYFGGHMSLVRGWSHVLIALENRMRAIEASREHATLDGVKLVTARGKVFRDPAEQPGGTVLVSDGDVFGRILEPRGYRVPEWQGLFVGFDVELHRLIVNQDFSAIVQYRWRGARQAEEWVTFSERASGGGGDRYRRSGTLRYMVNDSGVAFGHFDG